MNVASILKSVRNWLAKEHQYASEAYQRGMRAAEKGAPYDSSNPYPWGTLEWDEWREGWSVSDQADRSW